MARTFPPIGIADTVVFSLRCRHARSRVAGNAGVAASDRSRIFAAYRKRPLYLKILIAMVLGVGVGLVVSPKWATRMNRAGGDHPEAAGGDRPAVDSGGGDSGADHRQHSRTLAGKLVFLLILNTIVAILIGLLVANVIRPGKHANLPPGKIDVRGPAIRSSNSWTTCPAA